MPPGQRNNRCVIDLRKLRDPRTGLAAVAAVIVASLAPVVVFTSAVPDPPGATAAAVALLVVQAGTLVWMPTHPERAMSVAIACPPTRSSRRR
jgi:cobalamin synthase